MTAFLVINKDTKGDKEYGTISLKSLDDGPNATEHTFNLRNNSLVIMKSRCMAYQIKSNNQKVFVIAMRIGGPKTKDFWIII